MVTDTTPKAVFNGNDATTAFPFSFRVDSASELVLVLKDDEDEFTVLASGFTVTLNADQEESPGGSIAYPSAGDPLATGEKLIAYRETDPTQEVDLETIGELDLDNIESMADKLQKQLQEVNEKLDRAVKFPLDESPSDDDTDTFITRCESAADGLEDAETAAAASAVAAAASATSAAASATSASSSATAAATARTAAETAETNAETAETNAETAETNAETAQAAAAASETAAAASATAAAGSATTASTQATNAATSATNAATSATNAATARTAAETAETNAETAEANAETAQAAAELAAATAPFRDVVFLTSADSPYTVADAVRGKILSVDASGGAVTINLPTIAGLSLAAPFVLGVKKTDSGGNSVTLARGGTDTIDGATTKVLAAQNAAVILTPDAGPSPDIWTSFEFGALADAAVTAAKLAYSAVNGQSAETAPATDDELLLGDTSAGSLKKMILSNLWKVINLFTEDTTPDFVADFIPTYDASASGVKKVLVQNVGRVVQRVYAEITTRVTCATQIPGDDTIPQNTEGVEVITCSITPKSATNRLRVTIHGHTSCPSTATWYGAIFRDTTADAKHAAGLGALSDMTAPFTLVMEEVAGATAATTYKLRVGPGGAVNVYVGGNSGGRLFGGVGKTIMVIEEIVP